MRHAPSFLKDVHEHDHAESSVSGIEWLSQTINNTSSPENCKAVPPAVSASGCASLAGRVLDSRLAGTALNGKFYTIALRLKGKGTGRHCHQQWHGGNTCAERGLRRRRRQR